MNCSRHGCRGVETRDEATERVTEIFDTSQSPDSTTGAHRRCPPASGRGTRPRSRSDSQAKVEAAKATAPPRSARRTPEPTPPRPPRRRRPKRPGRARPKAGREKGGNKALVWVSHSPVALIDRGHRHSYQKHRSNRH